MTTSGASKKQPSRYSSLGLLRNPFSGQILPSDQPPIPPYPKVREQAEEFMDAFLANRASRGLVFTGDYGTGKTYHLKWIKNEFDKHQDASVRTIFLETPGFEPYDLLRGILNEIGEEQIAKGVWGIVQPIITQEIRGMGMASFLAQFANDIHVKARGQGMHTHPPTQMMFSADYYGTISEEDLLDHRRFLMAFGKTKHLSKEKLRDYVQSKICGPDKTHVTKNIKVARLLSSICCYAGEPALTSWERLVVPGTDREAFPPQGEPEFLQAIVRVLVKSGIEYLVLCLDEVEKVPLLQTMTEREAKRYLDTFRMLIDRNWHGMPFAWVLGSNDDAWGIIEKYNKALPQRLVTPIPLPRTNDKKVAAYIITGFLGLARVEGDSAPPDSLLPFPDDLLEIIPLRLRQTPRDLVKICDLILEAAVREHVRKPPIPGKVIQAVLTERFGLDEPQN